MPLIETAEHILFLGLLRSHGHADAEFRLTGRERQPTDPIDIYGFAVVDCVASGRQLAYPLDETADWLMVFRKDLAAGSFASPPAAWPAQSLSPAPSPDP
ncbi:hypothetical protein [Cupriavidus numazuensis]|uniref:Uncharacterized protein n=1 Tax=Cupriavidus numazuensis TaxID=221992 RepID=A0ABN7QA65_9BURK|nr:hypothetical protein [Cupriavidus numazuensis]CAG2156741.1 hypothetical protein LMG26411_05344 [Cupriavidus numazuensis]